MFPVHYRGVKADTTAVPWCGWAGRT